MPVLLVLGAVALEKFVYYGALPLGDYAEGHADYVAARLEAARGDDPAALKSIRAALLHSRTDPAFWRLAAEISGRLDSPEATYCWQQLDRLEPGAFETQIHLAESALRHQQLDVATTAVREVALSDQGTIAFLCAAGKLADACGEREAARAHFSAIEAMHPDDSPTLLALARWHGEAGDPAELARARRLLVMLVSRPAVAAESRRLLIVVDLKAGKRAEAESWSDELLRSGRASLADRVQRLDLLPGAALPAALNHLMDVTSPQEIVPVADWLVAHGQAGEALAWIRDQPQAVQDDPAIGRARADCLSALGLWRELRLDQATESWAGLEPERLMYLARASAEIGFEPDARAVWSQAVLACRDYPDYLALLDYIARDHLAASTASFWADARVEVWTKMSSRYPDQAWIVRALLRDALARRDSLRVQDCWLRLAAIDPDDVDAAAAGAQISLLRGSRVEKSSALLERLRSENPANAIVATARAYDLYRQGRFGDGLTVLGGMTPEELNAPERSPYLGALLAAAGPEEPARARLRIAGACAGLLDEERALVDRSRELVSYRVAMGLLLQSSDSLADPAASDFFAVGSLPAGDSAIQLVGRSVALSRCHRPQEAMLVLSGIDPAPLDPAGLSIYLGGVLDLAGERAKALPYLELSADLPFEPAAEKFHSAVESWWGWQARLPNDAAPLAGLLAVYRGLDRCESDAAFWLRDEPRELRMARHALACGLEVSAIQERLQSLVRRVPATPEIQAQCAYALLLQGRPRAARDSMETLTPADLAQPGASLYYGVVLAACGEKQSARAYLRLAEKSRLTPEEIILAAQAEKP